MVWEAMDVEGLLKTATRFKRPPFFLRCWPFAGEKGRQETAVVWCLPSSRSVKHAR